MLKRKPLPYLCARKLTAERVFLHKQAKAASSGAIERAKAFNEEHKVTERTAAMAKSTYSVAKEFDTKHDVSGKVGRGLLSGFNKLSGE